LPDKWGKGNLVALALSGALDSLGVSRWGVVQVAEELSTVAKNARKRRKNQADQFSLFAMDATVEIPDVEYPWSEKLKLERDLIGIYVSGHPLDSPAAQEFLSGFSLVDLEDVPDLPDESEIWVGGIIHNVERRVLKSGETMAFFEIQDQRLGMRTVAFPKNLAKVDDLIQEGVIAALQVRTTMEKRTGRQELVLYKAKAMQLAQRALEVDNVFRLRLPRGMNDSPAHLSALKALFVQHPGPRPVALHITSGSFLALPDELSVDGSDALVDAVRNVFESFWSSRG
jgi:DNA polymerase-3 subunit alpha